MKQVNATVAMFLSVLLVSCTTGYRPLGDSGGYWDEQIEPTNNRFTIGYDGNKWHSNPVNRKERVIDLALLRSAEVALENGFKYFVISDSKVYTEKTSLLQGSLPSNTTSSRLKRINTSETYQIKATFTTVNYVDLAEDFRTNAVMQSGEFKGYAVYKADLVVYTILRKYNMDSGELMPNFEQYGNISSSTSQQAIETIDRVPTNPQ
ncbi:MAG: hypothetical protein NZ604_01895 [Flavobacteriales bacterium]|nr:hypothetical protein [Flavobacteriales bacterium]